MPTAPPLGPCAAHRILQRTRTRVAGPNVFLDEFAAAVAESAGLFNAVFHVLPARHTFDCLSRAEFDGKAGGILLAWQPRLSGARFYVRPHRRGQSEVLSTRLEERLLSETLHHALVVAGPAHGPPRDVTRRTLLTASLAGGALQILGCQPTPLPRFPEVPRHDVSAYLIASGWHTEIALRVSAMTGPLQTLARDFPSSDYLVFGWGEREYYMARQPSLSDALRALFPGPAVLLVTPLDRAPRELLVDTRVFGIGLSTAGLGRLVDYVWAALARSADGTPRRLTTGPYPGSVFYAATGTYSAGYTCNTWTADGLRVSGIPVSAAGVVLAGQLTDQVQALFGTPR